MVTTELTQGEKAVEWLKDTITTALEASLRPSTINIEHPWTERLAYIDQRESYEREAGELIGTIEHLGAHPLLTTAQNHVDRALRTLGAWTDAGKPGSAQKENITQEQHALLQSIVDNPVTLGDVREALSILLKRNPIEDYSLQK